MFMNQDLEQLRKNVTEALRDLLQEEVDEKDAREKYDGYEWGHHGYHWSEASRIAGQNYDMAFRKMIDAYVSLSMKLHSQGY